MAITRQTPGRLSAPTQWQWRHIVPWSGFMAVTALVVLAWAYAQGASSPIEAETGKLANGAVAVAQSGASGGKMVAFRPPASPTPTPAPTATPAAANTYYVAPTGNDAAAGSSAAPWKTLQKAASAAPLGATVKVRSGTYAPFTASRGPLTIAAESGAAAIVQGAGSVRDVILISASGVSLSGLTVAGCVPNSSPAGSYEDGASSGVRINDAANNVTLTGLTIRDSHGVNAQGLPFGCVGIMVHNAAAATIDHNEIYHNGYGIFVNGGGQNLKITNNNIHDQDVIIRNTTTDSNDDYGAVGIGFTNVSASPGPVAQSNTLVNNAGPSHDYGADGGGFEIYKSSNITMTANTIANNDNILETGTDSGVACANNVFSGNTASGRPAGSSLATSVGLILRCASAMKVTGNTLGPVDYWMFDIAQGSFGGAINGLTITGNHINQNGDKIYALEVNPAGLGFAINNNQYHTNGSFATDWTNAVVANLAAWRTRTGFDQASTTF